MWRWAAFLVFPLLILVTAANGAPARAGQDATAGEEVIFTTWGAAHYALLPDGDALWIGTASGLVRLNQLTGAYERYSTADGLPHRRVYVAASDDAGNRWFGGDDGLSKLNSTGQWTHYNRDNSDLQLKQVNGIAVSAAGDLWLGSPDGATISRLRPDGSWSHYPNREAAVSLGYDAIKQTSNPNKLWTVAGDEVWIGYNVFNGTEWLRRAPEDSSGSPTLTAVDNQGRLYAVDAAYGGTVYRWEHPGWSAFRLMYYCEGSITALAVDQDDTVWVGGSLRDSPYSGSYPAYGQLPAEPGDFALENALNLPPGLSVLRPAADGLWVAGPNWLQYPNGRSQLFEDVPFLQHLHEVVVDGHGTTWVNTIGSGTAVLQMLDDRGTGTTTDDQGTVFGEHFSITAVALAENGDLWLAGEVWARFNYGLPPRRYYGGQVLEYTPPGDFWPNMGSIIGDIYVEDARHTWFVFGVSGLGGTQPKVGIWRLDDGGTPADFSDDTWNTYDTPQGGTKVGVAAARDGRLWYGNDQGVYLYEQGNWRRLHEFGSSELIPAHHGLLIVNTGGDPLIIAPDGGKRWRPVADLVHDELPLLLSTTERNQLWHIAPDGAVWYWQGYQALGRYDGRLLQIVPAPLHGGYIEVDRHNHVWLAGEPGSSWPERNLWRVSPRPDFKLSTTPIWFLRPNESREFTVSILSIDGYAKDVRLALAGLPAGVTGDIAPATVLPGTTAVITLTGGAIPLGSTTFQIAGTSTDYTRAQDITLAVVEQDHAAWLPILANKAAWRD